MRTILSLTVIILVLFSCNTSMKENENGKQSKKEIIENFTELVKSDVKDDNIDGSFSLAIIHKDSTLALKSYGNADLNTIFRIGSISKSFAGFLMIQLQQEGNLNINDPVEKYLPEIKSLVGYDKHPPITLKQLATHTSGLDRESRSRDENVRFGNINEWENNLIKAIPETSFRSKPGETFGYSNIGFAILGLTLSKIADKSYIELVQDKIFRPLEMNNTYFEVPENQKENLAKGMAGGPTAELDFERPKNEQKQVGYRIPNGGIYSTPSDMAKFMKACMGYSNLLNENNIILLQTTQTPTTRLRSNYSFGFDLYSDKGINTVGHAGSNAGYTAHFEYEKDSEYGVILMRNYNFGNTNLDLRSNSLLRKLSIVE
ncbi:serine hydrolase domain-containing protein [Winogradskyella helgolandensis]|uniref:serine hydrolase domain-containing protein n=1 Tax=Winogradskyella helgolandensis TaxID=2697010 RepID=UPI0015BB454B|nr:serine hydrolase domain-containing protein [Winogradskyella helgolandensis]